VAVYPGYADSKGAATESALVETANIAHDYLTGSGLRAEDIVILVETLRSSIAIQLAEKTIDCCCSARPNALHPANH